MWWFSEGDEWSGGRSNEKWQRQKVGPTARAWRRGYLQERGWSRWTALPESLESLAAGLPVHTWTQPRSSSSSGMVVLVAWGDRSTSGPGPFCK